MMNLPPCHQIFDHGVETASQHSAAFQNTLLPTEALHIFTPVWTRIVLGIANMPAWQASAAQHTKPGSGEFREEAP